MSNTSATGGPLIGVTPSEPAFFDGMQFVGPTTTTVLWDDPFDDAIASLVAGVTGLAGQYVRPRWQPTMPKKPEPDVNWAAVGIYSSKDMSALGQIKHDGAANGGLGGDIETMWEETTVLISFYGPNAWQNIGLLQAGIRIPQNREALFLAQIAYVDCGPRTIMSEVLENKRVYRRIDMPIRFRRAIMTFYPIYNILSANGVLNYVPQTPRQTEEQTGFNTTNYSSQRI